MKCISEGVRIGRIVFHPSKLWKSKFFILCDTIFLVRWQGKFEIDHSWEWKGQANAPDASRPWGCSWWPGPCVRSAASPGTSFPRRSALPTASGPAGWSPAGGRSGNPAALPSEPVLVPVVGKTCYDHHLWSREFSSDTPLADMLSFSLGIFKSQPPGRRRLYPQAIWTCACPQNLHYSNHKQPLIIPSSPQSITNIWSWLHSVMLSSHYQQCHDHHLGSYFYKPLADNFSSSVKQVLIKPPSPSPSYLHHHHHHHHILIIITITIISWSSSPSPSYLMLITTISILPSYSSWWSLPSLLSYKSTQQSTCPGIDQWSRHNIIINMWGTSLTRMRGGPRHTPISLTIQGWSKPNIILASRRNS